MKQNVPTCDRCGGPRVQWSRANLLAVGLALIMIGAGLPWLSKYLFLLAVPLALGGGFMLLWATLGKGLWCPRCKTF